MQEIFNLQKQAVERVLLEDRKKRQQRVERGNMYWNLQNLSITLEISDSYFLVVHQIQYWFGTCFYWCVVVVLFCFVFTTNMEEWFQIVQQRGVYKDRETLIGHVF